ncbi:MAG: sulfatase family protein [Nocardioides sp.]
MARRPAPLTALLACFLLLVAVTASTAEATGSSGAAAGPATPYGGHRQDPSRADVVTANPLVGNRGRPNVVVIMADDARNDDLRFMPNVRRLITDQGVRFTNTFSPQPLCCPARASFLTGQYSHNHHVWSHVSPFGFRALHDAQTLPVWLQRSGYDTTFLGKYLNGYGTQQLRWGGSSLRYVPPGWSDWRGSVDGGVAASAQLDGGTYRYFNTTLDVNGVLQPHHGQYQTYLFSRIAQQTFRREARSPRPFFSWLSFVAPHHGMPHESDDPNPVRRSDGTLQSFPTPARPHSVWGRFDNVIRHSPGYRGQKDVSKSPFFIRDKPVLNSAEERASLQDTRERAEALSVLDDEVAHMIRVLRETGELKNTYVVFTSDNGFFLGEHRMREGKILPYEPSLRVPMVIRGPGIPHGQVRTDPFTTIDFAPTFLQAAGVPIPKMVDGTSMLDVAKHGDRGWKTGILTETGPRVVGKDTEESDNFLVNGATGPSPLRFSQGVRTGDYLYVEHASREKELYDLRTDPRELHNLVDEPRMRRVQDALAHELDLLRNCKGPQCRIALPRFLQTGTPAPPKSDGAYD